MYWDKAGTSMLWVLFQDCIGGLESFLELPSFVEAEEFFEQSGLLGSECSLLRDAGL